jgi:hypothetical protein
MFFYAGSAKPSKMLFLASENFKVAANLILHYSNFIFWRHF